ncbi:hypothetical protein H4R99_002052 [Coemansia sp. RSA 1722]|nr:hypothetical protein H4R99_002052 [Coemansia sp. RSA 1722]
MVMPPVIEFEKEQWPEERFDLPLSSSNAIQSLVLEHMRDIKPFINVLPGFAHNLSNLYILSMRATHVAMDSVIAMVKYLPALHEFHSRFGGFSPEFHLPEDKIQCMETCAVASSRLAIWEIWDAKIDECGALAYSCVLLSVACKSFASLVYVEPEYSTMVAFNKALETLGKLPDFAAYSENIARLRFKTELD